MTNVPSRPLVVRVVDCCRHRIAADVLRRAREAEIHRQSGRVRRGRHRFHSVVVGLTKRPGIEGHRSRRFRDRQRLARVRANTVEVSIAAVVVRDRVGRIGYAERRSVETGRETAITLDRRVLPHAVESDGNGAGRHDGSRQGEVAGQECRGS